MNKQYLIALAVMQAACVALATPSGRSPSVAHYNQPVVSPGNSGGHSNATKQKAQLISGLGTFAPITGPTTISSAGQYIVNNDFSVTSGTGIAITASDVVLDLDNRNIDGTGGGVTGISIATGISHVLVGNGTVRNMSGSGISVQGNQCTVVDADLAGNSTGVSISSADNVVVDGCRAIGNSSAGFALDDCTNNIVTNCVAYNNGGASNAHGFVSTGGTGNSFDNCVAKDSSTSSTASDVIATGFMLDTEETRTAITNSQAIHTTTPPTGSAKAYGILLQTTFDGDINLIAAATHGSDIVMGCAWSSDGALLAVAGTEDSNAGTGVYRFNGRRLQLITNTLDRATDESVDWSPNNEYLAVGGRPGTDPLTTNIYGFTGDTLELITSAANTNAVHSIHWSPDGNFFATGDDNGDVIVYSFDGNIINEITSVNHGDVVRAVRWSADGHLAIGGVPASSVDTRVYTFDGSTLTQVATANHGTTINGLAWSPSSTLLAAVGESASGVDTILYSFTASSLTVASSASHGATVRSVSWSRDGLLLATCGDTETTNNTEINIYSVASGTLSALSIPVYGATAYSIAWSPHNRYVGVVGDFTTTDPNTSAPALNIHIYETEQIGAAQCTIQGSSATHTAGSYATGIGIQADSLSHQILENKAFNNDINYMLTTNHYDRGLAGSPTLIQNIGLPPA